jgi:hypothetical protein
MSIAQSYSSVACCDISQFLKERAVAVAVAVAGTAATAVLSVQSKFLKCATPTGALDVLTYSTYRYCY